MELKSKMNDFFKNFFVSKTIVNKAKSDSVKKEDYKIDEEILLSYYRSDPEIKRGINTIVNKMFSDGYYIEIEENAESEEKKAREFMSKSNFIKKLKNDSRMTLITGNGYQEINIEFYKVWSLNPPQIEIVLDKQIGEPKEYIQRIDGKEVARIEADNIIHYTIENLGDSIYGIGLVESILYSSAVKKFAERTIGKRFESGKLRGFWNFKNVSDNEFEELISTISANKDNPQLDLYLRTGNNSEIVYQDLIKGEDMQFIELLKYFRQKQITGLMLHPIQMGIPEGSNKSTSQEENKDFDEVCASYQESIEDIVTQRLFKDMLKLERIKFKLSSVNKRDSLRETEIAERLNRLPTSINEVREELGFSKIEEEWADEIRKTSQSRNPFNSNFNAGDYFDNPEAEPKEQEEIEEIEEDKEESKKNKSIKQVKKKELEGFPKESPINEQDEEGFFNILNKWINDIQEDTIEQLKINYFTKTGKFKKKIPDPEEWIKGVIFKNNPDKFKLELNEYLAKIFAKGNISVEKELNRKIVLNSDILNFLEKYTFDLVKGVNEDISNKLHQVLRRGVLEGSSIDEITNNLKSNLDINRNRCQAIARTETNRISNQGRVSSYKQAGVNKLKWSSVIDERTSEYCKILNGQIINLDKGEKFRALDFIGDSPPAHISCRSTITAILD